MSNEVQPNTTQPTAAAQENTKFCKYCGAKILSDAVLCTACGRQVEEIKQTQSAQPTIVINNENNNVNSNTNINNAHGKGREKNKWVSLLLCFFLGALGAHKFYEGKIGAGILYLLTCGVFGIGIIIDLIILLFKPNPYYV